ncbi:hypothetical protein P3T76_006196 [Phytophthora citrophthora]|uniref:Uncharacterized protein n=1 Tax=Phytophthora citrophthora TaxID=4793 RepID=A0AAD9LPH0_9STRA|nr:hypothetical protein P3T76_006196 [Phytophthora citrophthora]
MKKNYVTLSFECHLISPLIIMLGFQYVVAKSRELSSVVERELVAASNRSAPFGSVSATSSVEMAAQNAVPEAAESHEASSISGRNEGQEFLRAQQKLQDQANANHQKLMTSGKELDSALARARSTLQAQAASEQFLAQNFHLVSRVRQQLTGVRSLVLKLAEEVDEVENLLVHRCEEDAARQNAEFAAKQQQELEKFEARIAKESEGRKRELLEMRRQKLASAFFNDLRTYQTLVAHHGDENVAEARAGEKDKQQVTLDEVDLVVTADPEQLDAFYDSGSDEEEEQLQNAKFSSPSVPKELSEEEEKEEKETEVMKENEAVDAPNMEAKRGVAVSESELDKASKGLHATKGTREHSDSLEYDPSVAEKLTALYKKFDGDINAIFEELDENPRKALKHPPTSATEFGKKYAQGFYTMAEAK